MEYDSRLGSAPRDGMRDALILNGVDGKTGRFLPAPETEVEFARSIREEPLSPEQLLQYQRWLGGCRVDNSNRVPAHDVDPLKLNSAGWGVIFAPGTPPGVEQALKPLLECRKQAAGKRFKIYRPKPAEIASKECFLTSCHAGPGPVSGEKVPYYLLIVGGPKEIPFRFQYELDVQYAVGRLDFDDEHAYGLYAQNVKETEEAAEGGGDGLPLRQIAFWGASHQGDVATERSVAELIEPLVQTFKRDRPGWPRRVLVGSQANKEQLSGLLGGGATPSVLLTASHGIRFPYADGRQRSCQGALLCQDWPGEGHPLEAEHFLSGQDVTENENLRGLIALHFACYSGGTPEFSSFVDSPTSKPERLAPEPFVSNLAQRLLGHPRGALAVVGHVDRAWSTTFSWSRLGQVDLFENTLKRLLDGHPIGSAMEYFNQRHAELAVQFSELCQQRDQLIDVDDTEFSRLYRANNDARNFVVLGDPAVKAVFHKSPPGTRRPGTSG